MNGLADLAPNARLRWSYGAAAFLTKGLPGRSCGAAKAGGHARNRTGVQGFAGSYSGIGGPPCDSAL